ncbi:hypothetical protein NUU61_004068 [Penicillium alfredii]|uniref:Uncharacterized protein n=1 Tax=Penicillium alfredii TaxID=1506179 RepID=A0A9W9FKG0_9EURO|nr:uncharacterized protein NUU61_004068 [Penicillium alfredii]KAJ5101846.1 hypothetical protein NUU61_004068 [Penicillium alfredii]
MDAVNKVVNAASTALWGDPNPSQTVAQHGEEPISGVQGQGGALDPYDAGNREEQPGAPATEINTTTTPQDPKLDNSTNNNSSSSSSNSTSSTSPDSQAKAAPASSSESASSSSSSSPNSNQATNTTTSNSHPDQPMSAQAGGSSTSAKSSPAGSEQRSTDALNGANSEMSGSASDDGPVKVSEETLKGPQGPPPRPAYEFEKEMEGKAPAKEEGGEFSFFLSFFFPQLN